MKHLMKSVVATCCLFFHSCKGFDTIGLHIASSNKCEEKVRIITRRNSYDVIWNGQITPKLCSFSFTGEYWYTSGFYRICFWSDVYHLPSSMNGVQLIIKNHTGSPWTYDKYDNEIPKTCVKRALKLNVSILVPTGYREPVPKTYIQLSITASRVPQEASLSGGEAILGFISAVFLIILLCSGGAVCKTTGNCLSAPTQCPRWDNRRYRAPNVRTELDEIADTSEHPPASPSESMIMEHQPASSSESIIMEHPPSYNSLTDMDNNKVPTVPPPSYEDVS